MPKLVVSQFLTLDGVMQAPGDPDEDRSGGFDRGGWQLAYFDEVFAGFVMEGFAAAGGLLLGRLTYENFARHMPDQPADDPVAGPMNEWRKYVVSTSLAEPLAWQNSTLIKGDVPTEVARLKEGEGKDIQVMGSGELVQTLIRHDLVDEYRLMIHPLVLGSGKRLFRDDTPPTRFHLVDSTVSGNGVLLLRYEPADEQVLGEGGPRRHPARDPGQAAARGRLARLLPVLGQPHRPARRHVSLIRFGGQAMGWWRPLCRSVGSRIRGG